jgi:hypothetical protein
MSETTNFKDKRSGRFKRAPCDGGVEQETDTCEGIHNGAPPHMPSVSSFNFVRCRYSNSSGQSEMEELGFRCLDAI